VDCLVAIASDEIHTVIITEKQDDVGFGIGCEIGGDERDARSRQQGDDSEEAVAKRAARHEPLVPGMFMTIAFRGYFV